MTDFDALYRRHLPSVFRYAMHRVGRRDVAEDLTADAFLKLFRALDTIDPDQLPGWLLTIVQHAAIDYWRRQAVERRYLSKLDPEPIATAAPDVQRWLESAPALKPVHRASLVLRYVHGMSRAEIATRLGVSEMQVKSCLQYAHELLRKELVP